ILKAVCEEAAMALDAPAAAIKLYDPKRDVLSFASAFGLPEDYKAHTKPSPHANYDAMLKEHEGLVVVPDVQALAVVPNAHLYDSLSVKTVVTAVMVREGLLVGCLNVFTFGTIRYFTEDELALLKGLGDQAAQAITNARL